jgi:hypothetical protein
VVSKEVASPLFKERAAPIEPENRPNNDVILLPKLIVRPLETPLLGEHEILTKKGLDDLLLKRYPGASLKGQPDALDNYARLMYADDVRLDRVNHYQEQASILRDTGDKAASKELRAEVYRTFLRRPSWREEAMDKNVNRHHR